MLVTILVITSISIGGVWIAAELKSRTMVRILMGCLTIVSVSSSIWALKDLE